MTLTWYQMLTMLSILIGLIATISTGNILTGAILGIGAIFFIFALALLLVVKFKLRW